jgi:hypothetical protein
LRPPSIAVNFRRRSGAIWTGVIGCVASAASINSPMAQVRSTTPSAFAGVVCECFVDPAEIVVSDVRRDRCCDVPLLTGDYPLDVKSSQRRG